MAGGTGQGTWPDIVFAGEADSAVLSRAVRRGTLRRVAAGIYTPHAVVSPEDVVRRHLWRIVAHELPGAVIADRSVTALASSPARCGGLLSSANLTG